MIKKDEGFAGDAEHGEFVPVVHAKSTEEAERFRDILADHDIPAMIDDDDHPGDIGHEVSSGIGGDATLSVLVPEEFLDEANEVISDCEDVEDFEVGDEFDHPDDDEFDLADNIDHGDDAFHPDLVEPDDLL